MPIVVELTYEMGKLIGESRFEIEAADVDAVVEATRERFASRGGDDFDALRSRAAVAVNGILLRHRGAGGTRVKDGDRVTFVKAAAGG